MNDNFTACVQSVCHQHAHIILSQVFVPMVNCSLNNILFKVKPSLYQVFAGHRYHESLFRTRVSARHPKFYNLQVHFDEPIQYI